MKEKSTLIKSYIYESFYELLKKKHFDNINVSDICQKAGVSRMSFYRNFKSKEDLTLNSFEKILTEIQENVKKQEKPNQYLFLLAFFNAVEKYKVVIPSFEDTSVSKQMMNQTMEYILKLVPEDKFNRTIKYLPIFHVGALSAVTMSWLKDGCIETPEEMAKFICMISDVNLFDVDKITSLTNK